MKPKVLVGAPVCDKMSYCIDRFLCSIKSLTYSDYDILIVDNSDSNVLFNKLKKENIMVLKDKNNDKTPIKRVITSRNIILDYALKNNYDFILMMDSDVLPPKEVIEELLNCNKDIVSGLYGNYFMSSGKMKILPAAWVSLTEEEFKEIKEKYNLPEYVKSRLDMRRHLIPPEVNSNNLLEVLFPSGGCMLLSKKAFKKIRYGLLDKRLDTQTGGEDIYFFTKAREKKFKLFCYTKIKCEHLVSGKYKMDKEGNLIHSGFVRN